MLNEQGDESTNVLMNNQGDKLIIFSKHLNYHYLYDIETGNLEKIDRNVEAEISDKFWNIGIDMQDSWYGHEPNSPLRTLTYSSKDHGVIEVYKNYKK